MFWNEDGAVAVATPTTRLSSSERLRRDQSLPEPFPYALLLSAGPLGQVAFPSLFTDLPLLKETQ